MPTLAVVLSRSLNEAAMPSAAQSKADKVEHPQSHYATPDQLIDDRALSLDDKIKALQDLGTGRAANAHRERRGHAGQRRGHRSG